MTPPMPPLGMLEPVWPPRGAELFKLGSQGRLAWQEWEKSAMRRKRRIKPFGWP